MASFNQSEYTAIPREAQLKFLRDAWTVPTSSRAPGTARAPSKPPTSASGAASGRSSAECASIKKSRSGTRKPKAKPSSVDALLSAAAQAAREAQAPSTASDSVLMQLPEHPPVALRWEAYEIDELLRAIAENGRRWETIKERVRAGEYPGLRRRVHRSAVNEGPNGGKMLNKKDVHMRKTAAGVTKSRL